MRNAADKLPARKVTEVLDRNGESHSPLNMLPFTTLTDQQQLLPAILTHYTTLDALLGILESGTLWATNAMYLNDTMEIQYARDLFLWVLKKKARKDLLLKLVTSEAWGLMMDKVQYFVTCFCSTENALGQWRTYGSGGGGCAIVFYGDRLSKLLTSAEGRLMKVTYDRRRQIQEFESIFDRSRIDSTVESVVRAFSLAMDLIECYVRFKHPSFKEEREWRCCVRTLCHPKTSRYRVHKGLLVPYIELSVREPSGLLPIKEIVLGPTQHANLAADAIKALMSTRGYSNVEVTKSDIPLRS